MAWSNRHRCIHNPNSFCYICGCYTLVRKRKNIKDLIKLPNGFYFNKRKKKGPTLILERLEKNVLRLNVRDEPHSKLG